MKKHIFSGVLATILVLSSFIVLSSATENTMDSTMPTIEYISPEIQNADIQRQIENFIAQNTVIRPYGNYDYTYDTVFVDQKRVTKSDFAGKQDPEGVSMPVAGGVIFWLDEGGPSVSGSVTFELPVKTVPVSFSFGVQTSDTTVGVGVNIPADYHYYKIWITKTYEVKQANIYRTNLHTGVRELWMTMYPSTLVSRQYIAKVVK